MKVDVQAAAPIVFGRFTVIPLRRELLFDGQAVELGGRAFDVLLALIEADGAVVGKEALIARVWPDRVVEENNLQVQIAALRRALADDRDLIRTIAGRGYRFAAEPRPAAPSATTTLPPTNLQQPISDLIGRESELATVTDRVFQHRLITLTGAGGIGKTRLALEVARRLQPRFTDGVWVVELGPLSDPELVSVTVATTLGLTLASGAHSAERVAAAVGTKRMLLILDNCEHVIEAATRMTEALLSANAAACVLATSREPMRSQSEHIYQVPSLGVPDAEDEAAEALMRHGAVQLFVERAKAADPHFSPVRREAMIAAICRRLDGIPLAIELAAARTAALGIDGLAARLDDRFRLLTGGHRTALPRHQTLRATLDWSHDLLPDAERVVLRRLGVFAGSFSLDAAMTVATGLSLSAADVVDAITHLVNKSLLTADIGHTVAQYRLLETMRAYAIEKLSEHGELRTFSHRHAAYFRDLFEEAEPEWERRPSTEWLALQGRQIGNVRAALDWAFGADGDTDIGITLTVAAVPLWTHLSLMDECRGRVERAMAAQNTGTIPDYHRDMRIYAALGAALLYTKGPGPEIEAAWTRTLEIAERIGARDYQLRALWGLWFDRMNNGVVRESIALAERFCRIAGDSVDQPVGDRMLGLSLHYLGDQNGAQRHLDRMLGRYVAPRQRSHIIRFQFDQRLTAHVTLAKVRWLQGFPDQAMRLAEADVGDARVLDHALSLCNVLSKACPIALYTGRLDAAERFITQLLDRAEKHGLTFWQIEGRCLNGMLLVRSGDIVQGLHVLRTALDDLPETTFRRRNRYIAFLGELADVLGTVGETGAGLDVIEEALARSERNEEGWCIAELLRIKGELLSSVGRPDAALEAGCHFVRALERARQQGALAWELRCAMSLARLYRDQDQPDQARMQLAAVFDRFTEGADTADLKAARALLDSLA